MIKKISLSVLLAFISISVFAQVQPEFEKYFYDKTFRFDYQHAGDHKSEFIYFDEAIEEPYWGGSHKNLIDTFAYGRYFFEITSLEDKKLIYSRGYNCLFVEWQDTEEAEKITRSFEESVIFPFPKDAFIITIKSRSKTNEWSTIFTMEIDPEKQYIRKEKDFEFESFKVIDNGPSSEKLDVVFLAEGYTKDEMEKFKKDAENFAKYLLETSPFKEDSKLINIHAVMSISEESGTDLPGEGIWKNTVMNSRFYTFGSERYLMTFDFQTVRSVAANVPYDQIFLIVNTDKYGGGGIYNFYSTGASDNRAADFLLIHEFGHAFGGLADEYYTSDVAVDEFYDLKTEPWEPNITTLVDFDTKWKDMLDKDTPVPTPVDKDNPELLGVFEGAGYVDKGVYRPRLDCTMKSVRYDYFCPVCSRALQKMVRFYAE